VSKVDGTPAEVVPDTTASTLTIRIPDESVPVPAEEVIRYLESPGLAARTRKMIQLIVEVAYERGVALRVCFKGAWDYCWELDILDALRALFAQKGYQCV